MIEVQYIIDNNKSLLTIRFNRFVMNHLDVKCDDNLCIMQSYNNLYNFTLFKADTGYKITRSANKRKIYEINIMHSVNWIKEFEFTPCTYYLKKNGLIRMIIK
jgi:hypothetical protein